MTEKIVPARQGRPPIYTPELAAQVLTLIAGGLSLRNACSQPDMPSRYTVRKWIMEDPEFANQYAHACEERALHWADEMMDICDTEEDVQRARLKVDTRKWMLSKMLPKVYGEKTTLEHTGEVRHGVVVLPAMDNAAD